MKYRIECDMKRVGCFSKKHFGKQIVILFNSSKFKYTNLYGDKDFGTKYGEVAMSVRLNEFQIDAVHLSDGVKDSNGKSWNAWIITAQFTLL